MTLLTADGSFAKSYLKQFDAEIASIRVLGEEAFVQKIKSANVIIHNASTLLSQDLGTCLDSNFVFTRFLVDTIKKENPSARLILLSSMSILDTENDQIYGNVLEMSPYAYSKYLAETLCLKSELSNLSCVRFSTLYCQDRLKDGLSALVHNAATKGEITIYNGGKARRNFLPLDVAAQYVKKIVDCKEPNSTYNLAAPSSTSFKEVCTVLSKHFPNLKITDQKLDSKDTVLSEFSTKSVEQLGVIDFSLEQSIVDQINMDTP